MDNKDYCRDPSESCEHMDEKSSTNPALRPSSKSKPLYHDSRLSTFAQCLGTLINSLSLFNLASMDVFPTVVIGNLHNANSKLSLNDEQASWYASLLPIFQPFGCLLGGFLQNYIGRNQGLLLVYISAVMAWTMLYNAMSTEMLYVSSILTGISIGLAETPSGIYICEITIPKLRGTLVMLDNSTLSIGVMVTFFLSSFIDWRIMCLVGIGWCIFAAVLIVFIPDSPIWLIKRGKTEEAIKALCWLRGWVSETDVMSEFEELSEYVRTSHSSDPVCQCTSDDWTSKLRDGINVYFNGSVWRPFILLLCYTFFACAASLLGISKYTIVILNDLNLPIDSNWLVFLTSVASLLACFSCVATVKIIGKRMLSWPGMLSSSILSLLLGLLIIYRHELNQPWIFVVLYIVLGFTQAIIMMIPWILMGEVYPLRAKATVAGLTGAVFYLIYTVYIKTFFYLRFLMTTPGTFIFYGVVGLIGSFYLWMFMPETEGKTMAEIKDLFEHDARRLCNHYYCRKEK